MHPPVSLFEAAIERLTGKQSLAMAYPRDASLVGLKSWMELHKIPVGSEVVVSGLGTDSIIQNCLYLGLKPLIADVDDDTLQPTLDTLKKARSDNPIEAVIVKHYAGYPCSMDDLFAWCKARRITLMNDASDCLPSRYKTWLNAGWPADLTFFTFLGGSVLSMKDSRLRPLAEGYRHQFGSEQATIALAEVHDLQLRYQRRRGVWDLYMRAFEDIESLDSPWDDSKSIQQGCAFYPLRVQSRQGEISHELETMGIHSIPILPVFKTILWHEKAPPEVPVIADYLERGLILPLNISESEAQKVIKIIKKIVL
jgi:dTDP-4-amino-4,6-dideoxygalactose transaminase